MLVVKPLLSLQMWRSLCRTKDDAGVIRRDGVGRSRDLDRRVVEPAQVKHNIGFERDGPCRTRR